MIFCYLTLGPGTVKFLLKYSKLEFMVPGPNVVNLTFRLT